MWINTLIPRGSHWKYSSSLRRGFWSKCGCVIDTVACFLRKLIAAIPRRQPSGPMYSFFLDLGFLFWENKTFCVTSVLQDFFVGNHDTLWILFCICAYLCILALWIQNFMNMLVEIWTLMYDVSDLFLGCPSKRFWDYTYFRTLIVCHGGSSLRHIRIYSSFIWSRVNPLTLVKYHQFTEGTILTNCDKRVTK